MLVPAKALPENNLSEDLGVIESQKSESSRRELNRGTGASSLGPIMKPNMITMLPPGPP